jgi:hypothetical protein
MAKRIRKSMIGHGRKGESHRAKRRSRGSSEGKRAGSDSSEARVAEDFGSERTCLMKAEAVLHCLAVSLNYSSWYPVDGTTYSAAVDVARDLVRESMDRLEQRDRKIERGKRRPS